MIEYIVLSRSSRSDRGPYCPCTRLQYGNQEEPTEWQTRRIGRGGHTLHIFFSMNNRSPFQGSNSTESPIRGRCKCT
jgi:hypothetical protein